MQESLHYRSSRGTAEHRKCLRRLLSTHPIRNPAQGSNKRLQLPHASTARQSCQARTSSPDPSRPLTYTYARPRRSLTDRAVMGRPVAAQLFPRAVSLAAAVRLTRRCHGKGGRSGFRGPASAAPHVVVASNHNITLPPDVTPDGSQPTRLVAAVTGIAYRLLGLGGVHHHGCHGRPLALPCSAPSGAACHRRRASGRLWFACGRRTGRQAQAREGTGNKLLVQAFMALRSTCGSDQERNLQPMRGNAWRGQGTHQSMEPWRRRTPSYGTLQWRWLA